MKKFFNLFRGVQTLAKTPYPSWSEALLSGLLGFLVISLLTFLHYDWQGISLFIVPFGASAVLAFAAPAAPFSQPRNIIGGHFIAALVGVATFRFVGSAPFWALGLAVGAAIFLMVLTKTVHPPAGATALLPLASQITSYTWAFSPVLLGATLIVIVALLLNNYFFIRGRSANRQYPQFWL